ncbi:MAG: acyl-CoA dehydrogenase [Bdellovibrio sp. ArHS]|uniref:acyl-CoA dehydrogenase family protein n=1 Tax=Bdellovibrio sp. ArHS TaxID=1569284 RepID=UPI0005838D84|nr:acyl-CoA dehydrogenase family protein [Bdellovibrio sp. ArHS]KHD87804.1 MAG: acyl-CoA dehydrogenase [Bdellovibrio sp. ArHS]
MKKFESPNFLNTDSLFTEDELMVRNLIRDFVTREILPSIGEQYDKGHFPTEIIPRLGELGTLGATIQGHGCAGINYTSYGLIMQELERGDSGLRSFVSVQGALCMHPIDAFGTEEHKKKYLPKMAKGELVGCFGLTEPDFGSNPGGMITRARKDGNSYILNGSKMWITNGGFAGVAIVWAKDDEGEIRGFIVDRDLPGFTVRNIEKKFSLKASVTSELIFEDCRVPASQMLNVKGLKGPFSCLNHARFGISWGVLGAAMACYDEALNYAQTRIQFDKPIASFQLIQAKLVHMLTEITKGQLLALQVGRLKDKGEAQPVHISMAKMNNVSKALEIARMARDILGASGITYEYQTGRHMLNLESVNTYEGTEDIHRLIIGQHITGIPAFR